MGFMRMGKVVLKSLFGKPATQMYPVVQKEYPEKTRGHVSIDVDKCIFCGICSKKCPTGAIAVDRKGRKWTIQRMACIQCRCCVDQCPKDCLDMGLSYTEPGCEKVTDTYIGPEPEKKAEKPAVPEKKAEKPEASEKKAEKSVTSAPEKKAEAPAEPEEKADTEAPAENADAEVKQTEAKTEPQAEQKDNSDTSDKDGEDAKE